jgi:hypothetical protein
VFSLESKWRCYHFRSITTKKKLKTSVALKHIDFTQATYSDDRWIWTCFPLSQLFFYKTNNLCFYILVFQLFVSISLSFLLLFKVWLSSPFPFFSLCSFSDLESAVRNTIDEKHLFCVAAVDVTESFKIIISLFWQFVLRVR